MELQLLTSRHPSALALLSILSLFVSGLGGCQERIEIHTETSAPRLVIYGYITTDTARHGIRITRSSNYFSTTKPEAISGAAVRIHTQENVYTLAESSSDPGYYEMETAVAGQIGATYTLQVSLDFDGDGEPEAYEASSILPPVPHTDSIAVVPSILSADFLEVLIWGRLPEQESNYFSAHLYRNDTLLNDSLQGFTLANDEFLSSKDLRALPVFYLNQQRKSNRLNPGDHVRFQLEGLTREYSVFITQAQTESWGSMPLFGGPPANLETNIRPLAPSGNIRVSGFFTAYSTHQISMIYYP